MTQGESDKTAGATTEGLRVQIGAQLTVSGAPTALAEALRAAHRFPNPAYLEALRSGRRPFGIPRELEIYADLAEGLSLPRGYLPELRTHLHGQGPVIWVERRSHAPRTYPAAQGHTLRPYQEQAVAAALAAGEGLLTMPTGAGKTVTAMELLRQRGERALILVHSRDLLEQWQRVLGEYMGIEAGGIQGSRQKEGEVVTVVMIQTLQRRLETLEGLLTGYGLVLLDEAHRAPARTVAEILNRAPCRYRYGLTATPYRRDGLDLLIHRAVGPVLLEIGRAEVEATGGVVPAVVRPIETGCHPGEVESWADLLLALVESPARNRLIAQLATRAAETMPVLILTDRVDHVVRLSAALAVPHQRLHGRLDAETRKAALAAVIGGTARITVGTIALLGEGLDVAPWQALILATPISSRTKLLQAIGRVVRPHPGKARASFRKRVEIYAERGIPLADTRRAGVE